jgi:hypothetical protein
VKKTYNPPKLTVHGTVEEITKFFGSSSATDTVYVGGTPLFNGAGSQDGTIIPRVP